MPELTPGIGIVFGLVALAGALFGSRRVPNDMAAITIAVLLAVLGRWTGVTPAEAISGFASPAVITILAMFILSEGVRRTGVVQRAARRLLRFTGESPLRQLAVTLGLAGPPAGFVNNTPLVTVLVPLVTDLAKRNRTSPSRLLMPLSFAAMMGGTLTLIGTSTNLIASDLSGRLLDHPISMFEFTHVGVLILAVGVVYLMTVGRRLVPERIHPAQDLTQLFRMRAYLHRVRVPAGSPLAGLTLAETQPDGGWDLDIVQIVRGERIFLGPDTDQTVEAGDVLTIRAEAGALEAFARARGLERLPAREVADEALVDDDVTLLAASVAPDSPLAGETLVSRDFRRRHGGTVLAIRHGDEVVRDRVETQRLREGDTLLVLLPRSRLALVEDSRALEVASRTPEEAIRTLDREGPEGADEGRREKTPLALGIVAAVVAVAATGLLPIYLAALAGVVAMVAGGCLDTDEAYGAVSWKIVFLLAGILPLGVAMGRTGAADYLAQGVLLAAGGLPAVVVLGLFYLLTAVLANVISNNATVVLMVPVAVDAARQVGADPFAFVLAVMFAASTAFTTPVGNPTNLIVYTPGGFRYGDYLRAGAPLQLLLAAVTTAGIALFWGV